jgi:hypothetical protein
VACFFNYRHPAKFIDFTMARDAETAEEQVTSLNPAVVGRNGGGAWSSPMRWAAEEKSIMTACAKKVAHFRSKLLNLFTSESLLGSAIVFK